MTPSRMTNHVRTFFGSLKKLRSLKKLKPPVATTVAGEDPYAYMYNTSNQSVLMNVTNENEYAEDYLKDTNEMRAGLIEHLQTLQQEEWHPLEEGFDVNNADKEKVGPWYYFNSEEVEGGEVRQSRPNRFSKFSTFLRISFVYQSF